MERDRIPWSISRQGNESVSIVSLSWDTRHHVSGHCETQHTMVAAIREIRATLKPETRETERIRRTVQCAAMYEGRQEARLVEQQ